MQDGKKCCRTLVPIEAATASSKRDRFHYGRSKTSLNASTFATATPDIAAVTRAIHNATCHEITAANRNPSATPHKANAIDRNPSATPHKANAIDRNPAVVRNRANAIDRSPSVSAAKPRRSSTIPLQPVAMLL